MGYVLLGENILKTPYVSAGTTDFNKVDALTIYPNPTSNSQFNLEVNFANKELLLLEIFAMSGKKIYSEDDLKESNIISILNSSEGIYFVKLLKEGKVIANRKLLRSN